ncbi:ABC transporter ATP-binding protein [Desulfovibrio intestinalis]|uniref:Tungstate transport system ATP-binding protein n=1 Tax=Desulfovibrio intestinalis TaxID=58621 RepID=A0A7W8C154_9BACT|nr:ABC transporter ATP-binding protein [Desulfovibrio intestinalis]MBB5143678.1 tungstate transport system ATP-binding protein [Desulfovibrio intestinalis]
MTEKKDLLYQGRDLVQVYGDRIVLNVPHIEIVRGEALALTGPNGCGKSTLLRILAFLERPASGALQYAGGGNGRKQATLLLQDPYLLRMSVFSNVVMGLRLRNDTASADMVFEQSMRAVGFDRPWDFARRGPGELSGGERQRIALASRLALRPMVLLLDEPTANVDAASARDMVQAVSVCRREGATVVCSTHDPALIHTLGAREVQLGRRWDETF